MPDFVITKLPTEEAMALVDLGAALEPFIKEGSPADRATAKLDEQCGQQIRTGSSTVTQRWLADDLENELLDAGFGKLLHTDEPDVRRIAERLADYVIGYYHET